MSLKSLAKKFWAMIIFGLMVIAVGVLIFIYSDYFVTILMIASGIGAICDGFYTLFSIKRWHFLATTRALAIMKSIISILLGIAAVLVPMFVAQTAITILVYIFAFGLIFSAIVSFQNAATARSFLPGIPIDHFIFEGIISILIAILLFTNPTAVLTTFAKVIGIVIAVFGFGSIVWAFRLRRLAKNATIVEIDAKVKDAN